MSRVKVPFVLILATSLLAGCADSSALKATTSPSSSAPAPNSGAIEGTITDEELVPIEQARVQIVGPDASPRETFSDAKGAYRIDDLAPGKYQMFVTHVKHRDAAPKFADVLHGETTEANFQLQVLSVPTAFVSIIPYTFYYNVAWCYPKELAQFNGGIYCQGLGWDIANITTRFSVDEVANGPLMSIVHEMEWTAATPVCNVGMVADVYSPEQEELPPNGDMDHAARSADNPYHWNNPTVTSPTKIYAPRDGPDVNAMWSEPRTALNGGTPIGLDGEWTVFHWADHAGGPGGAPIPVACTVEERLNGYISLFYVEPAPGPTWTALEG